MNEDMLAKARRNASRPSNTNVSFVHSRITNIDIPDETADCVISNCVVNLVPHAEKPQVFREMFRLLRRGGRVAVSDILLKKELPEQMRNDVALYVGCVAGASRKVEYERWLGEAGFADVLVVDAESDLNVYTRAGDGERVGGLCCGSGEVEGEVGSVGCCKSSMEETFKADDAACCETSKSGGKEVIRGSCGSRGDGGVVQDVQTNFKDVDLNEWAGKSAILFSLTRLLITDLLSHGRIVQDICC